MNIKNKTVIITGAGRGIGRSLAVELAAAGARVICCGRTKTDLDRTVELIAQRGGEGLAVPVDITQPDQVREMGQTVTGLFGDIDLLFNNAGRFMSIGGVHELDPGTWWEDVTVNLYGSLLVIHEFLPRMLARNEGIIINMNGGRPVGGTGYACGKAGLMELTRLLTLELKRLESQVMVFSAGPGLVRTEMTELQAETEAGQRWIPEVGERLARNDVRQPEEIARATLRLLAVAQPEMSGMHYDPDTVFTPMEG